MKNKTSSAASKILSLALSLLMVLSVIPVQGIVAYAADEDIISIQYLSKNIVQSGVEIKIKPDEALDESYSGVTNEYGIWETEVSWTALSEVFYVSINGESKTITRSDEPKKFLIIVDDEKKWSDMAMPVAVVNLEADKTSVLRGESFELTATALGTPDKYQWFLDSKIIDGATSSVLTVDNAALTDCGSYSCKVTDINGDTKMSDAVEISVSEKTPDGMTLKAYADGTEIAGDVSRDSVKEIELRLENIPDDASVTRVKYYVNGVCLSSETSNLTYTFQIEDGVEEYTCEAEVTFDKYYEQTEVELSAPVNAPLLSQSEIVITVEGAEYDASTGTYNLTYSSSPKANLTVTVTGGSGTGAYELSVTDEKDSNGAGFLTVGKVAKLSQTSTKNVWTATINNAGSFNLKASRIGDGNYKDIEPVTVSVNVAKASPEGFAFKNEAPEAVVYNENGNKFSNPVVDGFSDVTYSIESGDCAVIDEKTGELTITKAGTVTVKAVLKEDKNYTEATATYTLTVNKATQAIEFEEKADTIYYGQAYSRVAAPVAVENAADGYGYNHDENVKVEYSIVTAEGAEAIAAVAEDGSLAFENQKVGTVTVKATLAGNDCYEAAEAEYTITVENYTVENAYSISGEQLNAANGWYTGDITITPAEGHQISKTNNLGDTNEWADTIVIGTEGEENRCDFYIRNISTGAISEAYSALPEDLKLDKSEPHSLKINYKTEAWYQEVIETITFGYYNSVVTFTLEAKDDFSGIKYFVWKFTSQDDDGFEVPETSLEAVKNGDVYESAECVLGDENNLQDFRGKISFVAYDFAGHSAESKETYIVVVDAQDPVLEITTDITPTNTVNNSYPYENADETSTDVIEVFSDKVEVTFGVIEKNFFEENVVLTVNGEVVTKDISWTEAGDNHYAVLSFDKDGDYEVVLLYNDIFGEDINDSSVKNSFSISKQFCIDTQAPVVTLVLDKEAFEAEDKKYHNGDVTAEIIVDEEKFRPSDMFISDVEGYNGMSSDNKQYLSTSDSWTYNSENGTYSASVKFSGDGEYLFALDYTDLSGKSSEQSVSGVFVIDTVNPGLAISTDISPVSTVSAEYPYAYAEKDAEGSVDVYSEDVKVTFTVTEKNFFPERAVITVNDENVSGDADWTSSGDTHTAIITFDSEGDYAIKLSYTDIFNDYDGESVVYEISELIAIDKTAPEVEILLSNENTVNSDVKYFNNNVRALISVKEEKFRPSDIVVSDIEELIGASEQNKVYLTDSANWEYDAENDAYRASIVFNAENADGNYKFTLDYNDLAGNAAQQAVSDQFVIDVTAPIITVNYGDAKLLDSDNLVIDSLENRDFNSVTVFDSEDIVVTVTIDELNFDPSKATVMLSKDYDEAKAYEFDGEWVSEGSVHTNTVTLNEKDVYKLTFSCTDRSLNISNDYSSPKIVINDTVPSITFDIFPESETGYRNSVPVDVTVKIFDEYFAQENVEITVKAVDIDGKEIELGENDIIPDYKSEEWETGDNFCNSIILTLATEGRYTVSVEYTNQMGDKSEFATDFVIDCTAPTHSIEYSQPVYSTVARILTFMLYNPSVDVTVTAEDNISGVDKIKVEYLKELIPEEDYGTDPLLSEKLFVQESEKDEKTLEGTWTVNAEKASVQAKGNISVTATDNAGNSTAEEDRTDTGNTIAIDNIASKISFSYGDARILDSNNVVISRFEENQKGNVTIYDKKDITVTVKVEDANFNSETVSCLLSKDSAEAEAYKFDGEWVSDGIVYTNTVTISGEDVYKLTVISKDLAGNESSYTSAKMVISEEVPEITFEIVPDKANTYADDHYNTGIRLNAKVFDEFFSAERAVVTVTATDPYGNDITPEYSISDWKKGAETTNSISLRFTAEGVYNVKVEYANAVDDVKTADRSFEIDYTAPVISMSYGTAKILDSDNVVIEGFEESQKETVTVYDKKDIAVTVEIKEVNFRPENVVCMLSKNSAEAEIYKFDGEWVSNGDTHTNTVTISGEDIYKLNVVCKDPACNESSYTSAKMVISEEVPEITFEIVPDKANTYADDHYNTGIRLNAKVFDEFFSSERAIVTVTATDPYENIIENPKYSISEWKKGTETANNISLSFAEEGVYNVKVEYTNAVGDSKTADRSFEIDSTAPVISMSYGAAKILDSDNVVIDGFEESQKETVTVYDKKDITVTVKIKEVNFRPENVVCTLSKNSAEAEAYKFDGEWVSNGDTHTNTVTISGEDAYKLTVACKDPACNEASYTSAKMVISTETPEVNISIKPEKEAEYVDNYFNTKLNVDIEIKDTYFAPERSGITVTVKNAYGETINVDYLKSEWKKGEGTSNIITYTFDKEGVYSVAVTYSNAVGDSASKTENFVIDLTAPVISSDIKDTNETVNYGVTITVTEENFNPDDFSIDVEAVDIGDKVINLEGLSISEWTNVKGTFDYKVTISNFVDGKYTITVTGTDKALNAAAKYITEDFTVDSTAPDNIRIQYSKPISSEKLGDAKDGSEIKYYNDKIKVTISADDSISGITRFNWVYNRQNGASGKNAEVLSGICHVDKSNETETEIETGSEGSEADASAKEDNVTTVKKTRTAVVEFYLPADKIQDIRGNLTVTATDRMDNTSEPYKDKNVLVIDSTKPVIEFEYSPSDPKKTDGDFESGGTNYYDSPVTVTIIIDDANFDSNKGLIIRNNDEIIKPSWTKIASGDKWKADIELSNDGSYVISAEYTDPSGNVAESKETGVIVVDRTAPVISVTYSPDNPVYTTGERKFYSEDQVATITITERNFNPQDIIASVTTRNIGESADAETDYAAKLTDKSAWKQDGDVYTATINYSTDGNYTFNIEYTDPSGNSAEVYAADEFTVDKSAPENLEISFANTDSKDGDTQFYDTPIKVTVTAVDKTSGVKSFDYSYTSSVTGETVKDTVQATSNGANARAEFYVPSSEAGQFKGTVKVVATDNSGNKTNAKDGNKTIVYDNKAPEGNVDLGTPVTNANGMAYYASGVNATITIEESNFYPDDVNIVVDGNNVNAGNWTNNGDAWTTSVNVSSDGQHKIQVSYTDKSGNQMETKESETFVIDHTAPAIVVNGISNQSAYNSEKVGFTITAKDDNFSSEGLNAELTVIVRNEKGQFETKRIELERAYSSTQGYTINVANLEEDGIYTLKCSASDLCGNDANVISVDGRNENTITFSVNRKGSTYDIDPSTKALIQEKQYTQSVDGDIVVTEINVTPIDEDKVKVRVNGVDLNRDQFGIRRDKTEGGWYKYTYTIYATNFEAENDYSVVVSSVDNSENTGYSDLKGVPIEFTVDKTAPIVSVSGIEANGSYKTDKLTISVTPIDAGGMIQKLEVFANEKSIAVYTGEEIATLMDSTDGNISVEIGEGTYDNIRFVCTDEAGNVYDSADTYEDIAISPNQLVLLWSKDWFKFSVIGGVALVAALIVIIILKKKKKEE